MRDKRAEMKYLRDYSKPLVPIFEGEAGHRAYLQMMNSSKRKYDYKEAARKVAEKLGAQGYEV